MVDRLKQLKAESCLVDALTALPQASRAVVKAWYKSEIDNVQAGIVENKLNEKDLSITMEAIQNAIGYTF